MHKFIRTEELRQRTAMRKALGLAVCQILAAFAAADSTERGQLHVLIYETDATFVSSNNIANIHIDGLHPQFVGQGQAFAGFGSKYEVVIPALERLPGSSIVVVSDGRDVLVNHAVASSDSSMVDAFIRKFEELTNKQPGAIIISAEAQCCVSALTHFAPGDLFGEDGKRTDAVACYSGKDDCLWDGDDKAEPWETFMKDLADMSSGEGRDDVFLNAGLMVGRAVDLIRILQAAEIGQEEDDQAVLTDFLYQKPEQIVLDYSQDLFGNNRQTCMFELSNGHLAHKQTKSTPLFIHTPGGSSTCHVELMTELGQKAMPKTVKRRLREWKDRGLNYKRRADVN